MSLHFDLFLDIFLEIFIITSMLACGLSTTMRDMVAALRQHGVFPRILLINWLIVPLTAYLLVQMMPVRFEVKMAILLLALSPGSVHAIHFTEDFETRLALATALTFVLPIISLPITPLLAMWLLPVEAHVHLPYAPLLKLLITLTILPLFVGLVLRRILWPEATKQLHKIFLYSGHIAFLGSLIVTASVKKNALHHIGLHGLIMMLIFIIATMAIGWYFGGPDRETRQIVTIITNMRNIALALLIAIAAFPHDNVDLAIQVYLLIVIPANLIFTLAQKRQEKHHHQVTSA